MRSVSLFPLHFEPIIAEKRATLTATHRPTNPREHDLVLEMARAEAQIEAAEAAKLLDLVRIKDRAEFAWDIDQNTYVNALGARLPKDSHRTVRALEGTRHGVLFLLEVWDDLSGIVSAQGKLTDDQRTTLCNVMGLPPELREGNPRVPAADNGRADGTDREPYPRSGEPPRRVPGRPRCLQSRLCDRWVRVPARP